MMYKIDHHLVDVEKEKYLCSGNSRTRGCHKFYQKRTTSEAYRNTFLYPATQEVEGYYVIPSENFECPSVRQRLVSGL